MCCLCWKKSFLPVCLYISLLMISEDDQFHHPEERTGPRKRGRPPHLPWGYTWTAVFNFFSSFKQVYILVPKGAHARGYALQLKIKHCWKLFLFEMLCACMNEWIYSTDNFSNQAVVDFKIQSSHTEKAPKNDRQKQTSMYRVIFVTYKQIASTWSNNHWFVCDFFCFIRII